MNERKSVTDLPIELITDILLRLPVNSLLCFKCVSKTWYNLINSQEFIKLQLKLSKERDANGTFIVIGRSSLHSFDFNSPHRLATDLHCPEFIKDPIEDEDETRPLNVPPSLVCPHAELIGSSNGLVCFYEFRNSSFSVYNPATRAYKQLPELTTEESQREFKFFSHKGDFAYDHVADDFKVFNFSCYYYGVWPSKDDGVEESHVYSLKANSWKAIPNCPSPTSPSRSVVTNNFLHWIGYKNGFYSESQMVIMRMVLSTQRYDTMPLPKQIKYRSTSRLAVLRGYLHVITEKVDVWIMKEYGVEGSWSRLLYCPSLKWDHRASPSPLAYSRDGQSILVGVEEHPRNFICCDLQTQKASKYLIEGFPVNRAARNAAEPWVESLISP